MAETANVQLNRPRRVIIAGYGIPGRHVADSLSKAGVPFIIIERNPTVALRCRSAGTQIIEGDSRDAQTLRDAGIEESTELAITLPDDVAVLDTIATARRLNPSIRIIARATYVSGGMEATKRGADEVVIAEQVVAQQFAREIEKNTLR
ncbi:MAG TPA: NAD(P)-binding protein [Tepidisphaeraceae bacterium]|nr:NAD(P)-binding protein [Tepidisphaeraceae bacterium]